MFSMFFFWEKIFKQLHITDIGLIWFWLQSQISWGHIDQNNAAANNEKYWVEYFPLVAAESRGYLTRPWLFTDITYTTPSIHPTIQFYRVNHIGQFLSWSNHYDWVLETEWYGESFGRDDTIIDDNDQSHNWPNRGHTSK